MKFKLLFFYFTIYFFTYSQNIDLSSENAIREYLNDKEFKVGNYGKVQFIYDKFNRDFGSIDFRVLYQISDQTIPLKASIFLNVDNFYSPKYFKAIIISDTNPYKSLNLGVPTIFQLFENGALYYQEKTTMTMDEWIGALSSGKANVNVPLYKKCD